MVARLFVGAHESVSVTLHFNNFIINILASCQYDSRINLQCYRFGTADDQDHTDGLNASAAFLQLRFVGLRTVGNRNHIAVFIKQTDFTDPPPAHVFRYDLLRNYLTGICRVDGQHIQRCATNFMYQRGLGRIRSRQYAIAIAYGHLGDLNLCTQSRGFCQFCGPDIG